MWYLSDRKSEYTVSLEELEKLFYENEEDVAHIQAITKKHLDPNCRPMNMHQMMAGYLEDIYVDGHVIRYPHGNVIGQGERRNYYRGEAQNYPTSKTTLWREVAQCENDNQRLMVRLLAAMRVLEFKHFLKRTKYVKWWEEHLGAPYYDAIAQHYGFMTDYLDITNDFNVAMFFACCIWEADKNRWRPMTEKECLERGKGVLYHAPAENVRWHLNADGSPRVIPIGYQPFMRCQKQTGYVMKMEQQEDFRNDGIFERLYFNHSVNLSNGVFEYMRQGEDIYPQESLRTFDVQIEAMKRGLHFSTDVFEEAINELNLIEKKDEIFKLLQSADFAIGNNVYRGIEIGHQLYSVKIPRQMINRLNLETEGRTPEKDNGIALTTRWCYVGK